MADGIKISEMTEVTGLLDSDLIPLVSEGHNRKIKKENLFNAIRNEMIIHSETEQVVGKWIDGKTIYRKSYQYDNEIGIEVNIDTSITSQVVDRLIKSDCCYYDKNSKAFISSSIDISVLVTNDGVKIMSSNYSLYNCKKFIVIIEYTKNTEV